MYNIDVKNWDIGSGALVGILSYAFLDTLTENII